MIILIIIKLGRNYILREFFYTSIFHWSLSYSEFPQVSRCLLMYRLLSIHFYAIYYYRYIIMLYIVWMAFAHSPVSSSSIHLWTGKHELCFPFLSFLWSTGMVKSTIRQVVFMYLFLLQTLIRSRRLSGIRWFVCISKSQRIVCVSFSGTNSGLCIYHLFIWSNFNFWHSS